MNHNEPINLENYQELSESLVTKENMYSLCATAEGLLEQTGKEGTINGVAYLVTPQYMEVEHGEEVLYARLARFIPQGDENERGPCIVFCTGSSFKNMATNYLNALEFRGGLMDLHLVAGNGENPAVDKPEYFELMQQIIDKLSEQAEYDKQQAIQAKEQRKMEQKRLAEARDRERLQVRTERKQQIGRVSRVVGTLLTTLGLLYGTQAVDAEHIDAKAGPVPMPNVIEWVVDWNNRPDHVAQGFDKPSGATQLKVGDTVYNIPLVTNYDTNDVPDASNYDVLQSDQSDPDYYLGEQSRPGLYASNFDLANEDMNDPNLKDDGCYTISGNYSDGKTSVFTQTVGVDQMITLHVSDTETMNVCKIADAPDDFKGTIYIYQDN